MADALTRVRARLCEGVDADCAECADLRALVAVVEAVREAEPALKEARRVSARDILDYVPGSVERNRKLGRVLAALRAATTDTRGNQ